MSVARKVQQDLTYDSEHDRLREIIAEKSFKRGAFTLSSGRASSLYFNMKPTIMEPEGAYLSAHAFFAKLKQVNAEAVGGLEMGAVPILGALAALSYAEGHPIHTFFVRKKPKEHGARLSVEGLADLRGKSVVIADDVTTSGQSGFKAVEAAREAGATVKFAISLVDREEGATEFFANHGITLIPIFKASEF
jgi:orotate phosphoribosyltransferase